MSSLFESCHDHPLSRPTPQRREGRRNEGSLVLIAANGQLLSGEGQCGGGWQFLYRLTDGPVGSL